LFLDEPTIGLDAVSKLSLREFLKGENKKHGVTMILTTHDMDDIEALCSRVMTIGHGRLLYDGTLDELRRRYSPLHRIRATLEGETAFMKVPGAVDCRMEGNRCTLLFDANKIPAHLMVSKLAELYPLRDIVVEEQDVEEMIAAMYREMAL
jgi:ABC-2 type transport system ATP-binding protein